jgi:F-type H+-transporting ATPase subunit b
MISIDFTLVLQMINFLIIVFIGKKMMLDPISDTVSNRDRKIKSLVEEAEKLKNEVDKLKLEYENKLQEMKTEVAEHHRSVREEVIKQTSEKIASVKKELDEKIEKARAEIQSDYEKAKHELNSEAQVFADAIVSKIMGKVA